MDLAPRQSEGRSVEGSDSGDHDLTDSTAVKRRMGNGEQVYNIPPEGRGSKICHS
jgi:hypothetical protein